MVGTNRVAIELAIPVRLEGSIQVLPKQMRRSEIQSERHRVSKKESADQPYF